MSSATLDTTPVDQADQQPVETPPAAEQAEHPAEQEPEATLPTSVQNKLKHLQRITKMERKVRKLEAEMDEAAEAHKGCKKRFDAATTELRNLIANGAGALLPGMEDMHGATDGEEKDGADAPAPEASAKNQWPAENQEWRRVAIALLGLPPKLEEKLMAADITTIGALADYPNERRQLADVPGIGPAAVAKIEEATTRFWAANPQWCQAEPVPAETPTETPAEPKRVKLVQDIPGYTSDEHFCLEHTEHQVERVQCGQVVIRTRQGSDVFLKPEQYVVIE